MGIKSTGQSRRVCRTSRFGRLTMTFFLCFSLAMDAWWQWSEVCFPFSPPITAFAHLSSVATVHAVRIRLRRAEVLDSVSLLPDSTLRFITG